jgi:hypothetical protein
MNFDNKYMYKIADGPYVFGISVYCKLKKANTFYPCLKDGKRRTRLVILPRDRKFHSEALHLPEGKSFQ